MQRCTVHKERNLLCHAPKHLHDLTTATVVFAPLQRVLTDERLRLCDPILDVGALRQVTQDIADFLR